MHLLTILKPPWLSRTIEVTLEIQAAVLKAVQPWPVPLRDPEPWPGFAVVILGASPLSPFQEGCFPQYFCLLPTAGGILAEASLGQGEDGAAPGDGRRG